MAGNRLLTLVDNIQSWDTLEKRIADLPTEIERGNAFEEFCHAFFLLDPVFQFKNVYRQNEIPPSIRERLGYHGIQDIGIDGVGITDDDQIFAYQAKFRSDRKTTPTLRELSTFFTVSDKADWRITIANSNKLPSSIDDRVRQSRILADRFDSLEPDFFDRLANYLKTQCIIPPVKKSPHITQQEAIEAAVLYYGKNSRGQLILSCGVGKTLASIWISEKLGAKKILVMLPSLSLLSQTLREWAINASLPFRYLCICSDTTVDLGNDSPIEKISDMDVPVTTDVEPIKNFLKSTTPKTSIIFSTYQSSKVLSEAVRNSGAIFDIGIYDEAHKTTGTKIGAWGMTLDDKNVPVNKRIFMTATPKIYAPHITKKAKEEDVPICSMDDPDMYGHPFYEIGFQEAVSRGHITDYKVIVVCVTDSEVKKLIEKGGRVITDQEHEWDAKAFAKRIALVKGIRRFGLKKAFTFHGRVDSARAFTDINKSFGIDKIFKLIEPEREMQKSVGFFHVNGTMSSGTRSNILKEFESVDIGIMSNARCLTEGVNIPAVDTVAFIDPKRSLIDIVQATGRAMRKADWKEKGYIFIPVFLEEDSDPEQIIKNSDFATVWEVLQAMLDQDQRMQGIISNMRVLQGKGEEGTKAWKDAMNEYAEKMEFYDLPVRIDQNRFIDRLNTRIVEIIGRQWDFWYGLTIKNKEIVGTPNVVALFKTADGYALGNWQHFQRQLYVRNQLSQDKIQRLEAIGFIWDPHIEAYERGFNETKKYQTDTGNANVPNKHITPEGFHLGQWQARTRSSYKKNKLSKDQIQQLEEIGFCWNKVDEAFERGFNETVKYKRLFGNANTPSQYITPEGFPLGKWQVGKRRAYKNNKLSQDIINRFKKIGFTWYRLDEAFEYGFNETLKYKKLFGTPNAPNKYITPEGFPLGQWQSGKRSSYKRNKLPQDKIRRFEEIGFVWDRIDEALEKAFNELLKYKVLFGHPNVPINYLTPEGFPLGHWLSFKRKCYRNNKIPKEIKKRLDDVGVIVDFDDDSFSEGFNETIKFKSIHGTPNAPCTCATKLGTRCSYVTPEGFPLGGWQTRQRQSYKKNKLSQDQIQQLEEIGFCWDRIDEAFEKGFNETLKYKKLFGTPNAIRTYITPEGFPLGQWQGVKRSAYNKNKLPQDKIKCFEEIGFVWDRIGETFERGFNETLKYKKFFGTPNVPYDYITPEGYNLGVWQFHRRQFYRNNRLTKDQIKRLESIGFCFDRKNNAFEIGFNETCKYKQKYGNANAKAKYNTNDGYALGNWQHSQRRLFKQNKLSPERIKRLEEIGFKWIMRK